MSMLNGLLLLIVHWLVFLLGLLSALWLFAWNSPNLHDIILITLIYYVVEYIKNVPLSSND